MVAHRLDVVHRRCLRTILGMTMPQMKRCWGGQAWSDSKTLSLQWEGKWLATSSDCRKKDQYIRQRPGRDGCWLAWNRVIASDRDRWRLLVARCSERNTRTYVYVGPMYPCVEQLVLQIHFHFPSVTYSSMIFEAFMSLLTVYVHLKLGLPLGRLNLPSIIISATAMMFFHVFFSCSRTIPTFAIS